MKQVELNVETREQKLERQHKLLMDIARINEQSETYRAYIKSLRQEKKDVTAELETLTTVIESQQMTMGVI